MVAPSTKRVWALLISLSFLVVAASGCLGNGGDDEPKNNAPEAVITSPQLNTEIEQGETITLDGRASSDPDEDELEYYWTSSLEVPQDLSSSMYDVVTLNMVGSHIITLLVVDDRGLESDPVSVLVKVLAPNEPPVAVIDSPRKNQGFTEDEAIEFDGSRSYDPEGRTLTYTWQINDAFESSTATFTKVLGSDSKPYVASLKVTDDHGLFDTQEVTFTVRNQPPTARINSTATDVEGFVGDVLNFSAKGSSDPEGGGLDYEWDFGDGESSQEMVTTHAFQTSQRFKVILTVTDDTDQEDTDELFVNILSLGPQAHFTMNRSARVDENITLDASLTEAPEGATITLYEWDFGDGNTNSTNETSFNHTWDTAGNYTVKLKVTDSNDNTNSTTLVIRIVPLNYTSVRTGGDTLDQFSNTETEWEETFEINWYLTNGTIDYTITNNNGQINWWLEFQYPDGTKILEDSDSNFNGQHEGTFAFDMHLLDAAQVGPGKNFIIWFKAEHSGLGFSTPQYEFDIFTYYD